MKRWLEDNPVGIALASVAGGLVVIALLLGVLWTLPPSAPGDGGSDEGENLNLEIPRLEESEPIEAFAAVTERPVFNPSRQPEVATGIDDTAMDDQMEEDVEAPELELAGVIITPSLRMVTLRQKSEKESLVAFEGQPLEGNYGSWHVSRIEPREITLSSGSGEEMQLQLEVHDARIPPPKPEKAEDDKSAKRQAGDSDSESDEPLSRAEEIRQRIAERREELRQAAEAEDGGEAKAADYRAAIQSMVAGRKKQNQADNDDEQ